MKKIEVFFLGIVICFSAIVGCDSSASKPLYQVALTHTALPTITSTPQVTDIPSPTSETPEVPALVKTSLELYRNGKAYEIVLGYDMGDAFFYATPRPIFPQKLDYAGSADIKRYADFDADGEVEYLVSVIYCGAHCSEDIRVYEYDSLNDDYYVADHFITDYPTVEAYEDFNQDGNPELIAGNYGFCYICNSYTSLYSAIMILRYEQGKFRDVTKEYRDLIEQDAQKFLDNSKANTNNSVSTTLASYLYDMYQLGKIKEARLIFGQVCSTVLEPNIQNPEFTCEGYRTKVESAIAEFNQNLPEITH